MSTVGQRASMSNTGTGIRWKAPSFFPPESQRAAWTRVARLYQSVVKKHFENMYLNVETCLHFRMHVHLYIYIHIYTYLHMYIHTHIHIYANFYAHTYFLLTSHAHKWKCRDNCTYTHAASRKIAHLRQLSQGGACRQTNLQYLLCAPT